jgi:hypothetical protein
MDETARSEVIRLANARMTLGDMRPRVVAGEPWALAESYGTAPEAAWGPREVLAHVDEMLPYWLGELERIIDGPPPGPTPFGRTADDPVRIGLIGRERTLPVRVLFARIDIGLRDWEERMASLTPTERAEVGLHPRLGEVEVERFLERFILGHLEEHVVQLEEILAARSR